MASFWLEFDQGGQRRQVSFEKDSVSIGRDRSSDFVLDHPTVSRQHALIVSDGGGTFRLVVLSRGGLTAVEGEPVEASEIQLYDESSITMGQYTVVFRSHQAPSKPRPQASSSVGASGSGQSSMSSTSGADSSGAMGAQNSFGNSFGDSAAGAGSGADSGGEAGAGFQASMGMDGAASQGAEPELQPEPEDDGGAGIRSWDEIAADSEREEAKKKAREESETKASKFNEVRQKSGDGEETNPVIVAVGIVGAVLLLGFAFLADRGSDDEQVNHDEVPITEREPVELSVDCVDERECRNEAEQHYARGIELIDQEAIEVGNLFEGYRRLLKAERYLEEAGSDEIPDDWEQWEEYHDDARYRLDDRFGDFRMEFHQASQSHRYHRMADILEEIEELYPDRTAREREWARQQERQMQADGVYPRR